jgi:hypothetical protein
VTGHAVNRLLTSGLQEATLAELVDIWRMDRIEISLPGMGNFASSPSLGNKLRGALGRVFMSHASSRVLQRQPCDWQYTSTAEIFFGKRPLIRLGDHDSEIAAPFVFQMRTLSNGALEVSVNVFGRACERTSSLTDSLIAALCEKVAWHHLAKDHGLFIPMNIKPSHVRVRPVQFSSGNLPLNHDAEITFLTPIDADRGNVSESPSMIFNRLARRMALIAPWHGVSLKEALASLDQAASEAKILSTEETSLLTYLTGGHHFANRLAPPVQLRIARPGEALLHLLKLGTYTNVGRGAALGLGRYRLNLPELSG